MNQRISLVTPEIAKFMLENYNVANYRKMNKAVVANYAADMKCGRWQDTGVPIVIDERGILKDGQHRLAAIVESGCAIQMLIVENVGADVSAYDIGRARTYNDLFSAENICVDNVMIGVARCIAAKSYCPGGSAVSKACAVSCLKECYPIISDAARLCRCGVASSICRKRAVALGCCVLLMAHESKNQIEEFFRCVNTGFPVEGKNSTPAIVLRNQIQTQGVYKNDRLLCHATIQAFRDFRDDVQRKKSYEAKDKLDDEVKQFFEEVKKND